MPNEFDGGTEEPVVASLEGADFGGAKKARKKPVFKMYGDEWDGEFTRVGEMVDLIPSFKAYYFDCRKKDLKCSAIRIIQDFNAKVAPLRFYPYPKQYQLWRVKWDKQLLLDIGMVESRMVESKRIRDVVKLRDGENALVPHEDELESGTKTLGAMLLNDAVRQIQDDRDMEDVYDSDEIIKRKSYALNVFAHVTRHVQGKEGLRIKKQSEAREGAGFLVNLLALAKAGKLGDDDMSVLNGAIVVEPSSVTVEPSE